MKIDFMVFFPLKLHGLLTNTEKNLHCVHNKTLFCHKYQLPADAELARPHT